MLTNIILITLALLNALGWLLRGMALDALRHAQAQIRRQEEEFNKFSAECNAMAKRSQHLHARCSHLEGRLKKIHTVAGECPELLS